MGYRVYKTPSPWYNHLPIIGSHLAKIGQIADIYAAPCSPDPIIWAYGFFQAIPTAAISLFKPQLIDINIKHRRGKPRKGKKFKFTASMLIRDAIIEIPVPRWVAFRVWEMGQRIGWYFLVADTAETFAINWMTTAYKYQGCNLETLVYFRAEPHHDLCSGPTGGGTAKLPQNVVAASNVNIGPDTFQIIVNGSYRLTWTVDFEPLGIPGSSAMPTTTYLQNLDDGQFVDVGEMGSYENGKKYASGSVMITVDGGTATFTVVGEWVDDGYCYCDLMIALDLLDPNSLEPDP